MTSMPPSSVSAVRLLWREQVRELPWSAWYVLRRLARRESRWYITSPNGRVIARFTSRADYHEYMGWLEDSHGDTWRRGHDWGMAAGRLAHDK